MGRIGFTSRAFSYPVVGKLQSDLDEGIWAGSAFLNDTLAKPSEWKCVEINVVSQRLCHLQRTHDYFLALK